MRKILAIASLAIRTAIRSRLFVSLLVILLFVLVGLPMVVKGDGTVTGRIRVLLSYTLALSAIVLGAATLWASCGSMSQDISEKQIRLVVVKPVRHFQIWFGKWLGLLLVNAALLCVVGVSICVLVSWNVRPGRVGASERDFIRRHVLVGRRRVVPRFKSVDESVRKYVNGLIEQGRIEEEMAGLTFRDVREQMLVAQFTVPPGSYREWFFDLPRVQPGAEASLRFSLSSSFRNRSPVTGNWSIRREGSSTVLNVPVKDCVSGPHILTVPPACLSAPVDGDKKQGERSLVVRFTNAGKDISHSAVFRHDGGMELLFPEQRFGPNLACSLVVILCYMALIAAVGLTAGTLFSFPVAVYSAVSILAVTMISHFFVTFTATEDPFELEHGPSRKPEIVHAAGEALMKGVDTATGPIMNLNPLGLLSDGIIVSSRFTLKAVLLMMLFYPALFALIGNQVLKKRELAR